MDEPNRLAAMSNEEPLEADDLLLEEDSDAEPEEYAVPSTMRAGERRIAERILRFGPISNSEEKAVLLYPVLGWRVAAVRVEYRELDFLQLASLQLAAAGWTEPHAQSDVLGLHRDVIQSLHDGLRSSGLLQSDDRSLTDAGMKALESQGAVETLEPTYGWVFQDALVGEMLPFMQEGGLRYWSNSSAEIQRARAVFSHPMAAPPSPEADKLASAMRQYRRLREDERQLAGSRGESPQRAVFDVGESNAHVGESANQTAEAHMAVRLVHDCPVRFLTPVQVHLVGSPDGRFDLSCPFGLPDGRRWVHLVQFARASNPEVEAAVLSLNEASLALCQARLPAQMTRVEAWRRATDRVRAGLDTPIDRIDHETAEWLKRFECEMDRLEAGHDSAFALFTAAGCVIEQVLRWLLGRVPIRDRHIVRRGQHDQLVHALSDVANALGVKLPEPLLEVNPGSVVRVFDGYPVALKPYLAALIVAATSPRSFHRSLLKAALTAEPETLEFVCDISRVRNSGGAHAGNGGCDGAAVASEVRMKLYRVVNALLNAALAGPTGKSHG